MKLTITRAALADLMSKGGSAAPKNSPVAILGHARLIARGGVLKIATSDFEMQAEATGEANIEREGATTVAADKLATVVSRLPGDATISLTLDGADVILKASPGRTRLKLATLPVADWPALDFPAEGAATFDLTGAELNRLFARTHEAARINANNARPIASVFLHVRGWHEGAPALAAVGTNGHIAVVAAVGLPEGAEGMPANGGGQRGIVLSLDTVAAVLKLFKGAETVRVRATDRVVAFEDGRSRLISKLLDTAYPDYQRIIPEPSPTRANVDRSRGLAVLNLLEAFAGKDNGHKLECGPAQGGLILAASETGGEGFDHVEAEIEGGVEPFGVSSLYLKTLLNSYGSARVSLSFNDPGSAIRVTADDEPDTVAVLMPMRVSGDLVRRLAQ